MQGQVKRLHKEKGYGFIQRIDGGDVFVHNPAIQEEGFNALAGDRRVDFWITQGARGLQAAKVVQL